MDADKHRSLETESFAEWVNSHSSQIDSDLYASTRSNEKFQAEYQTRWEALDICNPRTCRHPEAANGKPGLPEEDPGFWEGY